VNARHPIHQDVHHDVRRDRGQATVELALGLPLLCLMLLGVVQVAVIARDQLAVQSAAREAARAASVSADAAGAGSSAARRAVGLGPLAVRITEAGGTVTARVTYRDPTDVPMVGWMLPDVAVAAAVTMAVEPP
jgi:Flp pilus assembly protein TadG